MPSQTMLGCAARKLAIVRATVGTKMEGFPGVGNYRVPGSARRRSPGQRWSSRPEVYPDDAGALDVEVQESGPPPARKPADGTLGDPAFLNQLIDNGRDRATLKPRTAEKSPRDIGWWCRRKFKELRRLI